MSHITVKLDPTFDPAVTCEPNPFSVNNGNQSVTWKKGGSNKNFAFYSLTIAQPPFTVPPPPPQGDWVVSDDNTVPADYAYELKVQTPDGTIYSTKKTQMKVRGGGGGDPTVKNK